MAKYEDGASRDDLLSYIAVLEKRLSALEVGSRGQLTSIDTGALIVKGGIFRVHQTKTSEILFQIGPDIGENLQPGFAFRYPQTGTFSFVQFGDNPDGTQFVGIYDMSGNIVCSTDGVSRQGLATPWIPITGYRTADIISPPDSTTSATFANFFEPQPYKQHPLIDVSVITYSSVGTTGEIRMFNASSNTVLGATQTIPANDNSFRLFDVALDGGHLSYRDLRIQFRRTSGTGTVQALHLATYGIQSL